MNGDDNAVKEQIIIIDEQQLFEEGIIINTGEVIKLIVKEPVLPVSE